MNTHSKEISKLQQGGSIRASAIYQPINWEENIPMPAVAQGSPKDDEQKNRGSEFFDTFSKNFLKDITTHGLPSDVLMFSRKLQDVSRAVSNPLVTPEILNSVYIDIMNDVTNIKHSHDEYSKAREKMIADNTQGELVNMNGYVMGMDENGSLVTLSPTDLFNREFERQGLRLLTNGELMELRARNPKLAFNTSMYHNINLSPKIEDIVKFVNTTINGVGSTTNKHGTEMLSPDIVETLKMVNSGRLETDVTAIIGQDSKNSTTSNTKQIEKATKALYALMPKNYRDTLRMKAALAGYDPNNRSMPGDLRLLVELVSGKITTSLDLEQKNIWKTFNVDKKSGSSSRSSSGGGEKGLTGVANDSLFNSIASDPANWTTDTIKLNEGNEITVSEIDVPLTSMTNNNDIISGGQMAKDSLLKSSAAAISNINDAFIVTVNDNKKGKKTLNTMKIRGEMYENGDLKIVDLMNNVFVTGSSYKASYMPVTENGDLDLSLLAKYNDLSVEIEKVNRRSVIRGEDGTYRLTPAGESSLRQINDIARRQGNLGRDPFKFDAQSGKIEFSRTKMFIRADVEILDFDQSWDTTKWAEKKILKQKHWTHTLEDGGLKKRDLGKTDPINTAISPDGKTRIAKAAYKTVLYIPVMNNASTRSRVFSNGGYYIGKNENTSGSASLYNQKESNPEGLIMSNQGRL